MPNTGRKLIAYVSVDLVSAFVCAVMISVGSLLGYTGTELFLLNVFLIFLGLIFGTIVLFSLLTAIEHGR